MRLYCRVCLSLCSSLCFGLAEAPESNRRAPPVGIAVPEEVRGELEKGEAELGQQISELREVVKGNQKLQRLLPDVEIFHKAVQWPLLYSEFYRTNEFAMARALLKQGAERARALHDGRAPWLTATGL